MKTASFQLSPLPPPPDGGTAVPAVQVLGEVDVTNAGQLHHALAGIAANGLIVDLSRVGYIDSAGFAVLETLLTQHTLAVVISPAGVVRTSMTLLHMPFHDTIDAARAKLQAG